MQAFNMKIITEIVTERYCGQKVDKKINKLEIISVQTNSFIERTEDAIRAAKRHDYFDKHAVYYPMSK